MSGQGYILPKSYRKLGLIFFGLAVFALVFTAYLVWAKVIILVTPSSEAIDQEFILDVKQGANVESGIVSGKVISSEVEGSIDYNSTGSKVLTSDVVGEVTIINDYSKEQTLVEKTRLAFPDSPDEVALRLKKTVIVPAGARVKVQVYPEDFENFTEIPKSKFIIPGLWGPLQEYITAENEKVLNKEKVEVALVTEQDLLDAQEALRQQLYQKALSRVNEQLEPNEALWPKLINSNVLETNYSAGAGEEVDQFSTSMKLMATIVVFDEDKVVSVVKERLRDMLSIEEQLINLDPTNFSYELEKYNIESGEANIKVVVSGQSLLSSTTEFLDKSSLTGLTEEEVKSYFSQFSEVESVEVQFQPAWLKKTPKFQDKIEVQFVK